MPTAFEDPGALGGHVGVVGERVPRSEHDVVETGERHDVADAWAAVVGPLAEPDRVHQGERADRLSEAAPHQLDAGDQRRGNGAESDREDAETTVSGSDGRCGRYCHGVTLRCPR